jgi:hypothetical protein
MEDLKKVQEFFSKPMGEGYYEFDMEDEGPDYSSISSLEDELRRLIRFSNQSGSKGADAKIEQLKQRIAQLKNQVDEAKSIAQNVREALDLSDPEITDSGLQMHLINLNKELSYYLEKGEAADLRYAEMLKKDIADARAELDKRIKSKKGTNEAQQEDPTDIIAMDVPLFIRMLEYAREDAETDMDLHNVTERAIEAVKLRGLLSMEDYNDLVGGSEQVDEALLVPKKQIETLAAKLAAQIFSKTRDNTPAINILKKALEDAYRALDPNVKIEEEVSYLSLKDDNPFDDVPSIDIQIIDDKEGASSPKAFVNFSSMYHSGDNGKMEILRNNPALQDKVMMALQSEFQKTFRRVIHGILGKPFGLDEEKGYSPQLVSPENEKGETPGLTPDIMSRILNKLIQDLKEGKQLNEKKKKRDRCLKIADRKFDKPSAYKSAAASRCRQGEIWKNLK